LPIKDDSSLREAFTDATYFKDEALRAFKLGVLGLEERAAVSPTRARARPLAACLCRQPRP
jgi:arginine decarboxylase-like protein